MSNDLKQKIAESKKYIISQVAFEPKVGIVLGTGLGSLADGIDVVGTVDYSDIFQSSS